jgi:hypothetical protein
VNHRGGGKSSLVDTSSDTVFRSRTDGGIDGGGGSTDGRRGSEEKGECGEDLDHDESERRTMIGSKLVGGFDCFYTKTAILKSNLVPKR